MQKSLKQTFIEKLSELKASPKRSLGQNFLIDEQIIQKIISAAEQFQINNIIEVGPGLGALTEHLLPLADRFKVIELDNEFIKSWENEGLDVVAGDALKINWSDIIDNDKWLLVSNLPYQISSSLVIERSLGPDQICGCVLMFQKEVAERITAEHGNKQYGLLSVMAQSFWQVHRLTDVGHNSFFPPPKVTSRVLVFRKKRAPVGLKDRTDRESFLQFLKQSFGQRRKMLAKNLTPFLSKYGKSREAFENHLQSMGLEVTLRAEQVSVENFHQLYNWIVE